MGILLFKAEILMQAHNHKFNQKRKRKRDLVYAMIGTWPYLMYAVGLVSRFMVIQEEVNDQSLSEF